MKERAMMAVRELWTGKGRPFYTMMAGVALLVISGCAPTSQTTTKEETSKPSASFAPLVSVIQVPTPDPSASPVAKPAPPPLPASLSEPVDFALYMEVLAGAGPTQFGLMANPGCVMNSVFKRGMKLVWRFELYDMATRKRLTNQDGATVALTLPDQELPARFSQRGAGLVPDGPFTWVATWTVPPTAPLGSLDYSVKVAARDGRTGILKAPALVSESSDTRIKIIE
jgi:hypothetical protein